MDLTQIPLKSIKQISAKRELYFNKLGIYNLEDLLYFFPKDYENRMIFSEISSLKYGDVLSVRATVVDIQKKKINSVLSVTNILVTDNTGDLRVTFFNRDYLVSKLIIGETYNFYGPVLFEYGSFLMKQPEFESVYSETYNKTFIPKYSLTNGLTQNIFRMVIKNALLYAKDLINETLSTQIRKKYNLCELTYALDNIHFPKDECCLKSATDRLSFQELFYTVLGLKMLKKNVQVGNAPYFHNYKIVEQLSEKLPYELTTAQKRVIREICLDFKENKRVNRLIQGDVGSGKTVVAAMLMLICAKNNYQAALMAPTEILARQHYNELKKYFDLFDLSTILLVSSLSKKEKELANDMIKNHTADIVIGTNAMVFDKVEFDCLGLAITDEQHRFGVKHRFSLTQKGENPHIIVMTATPIPRTLALILYGDMDICAIDELPKGRIPVVTRIAKTDQRGIVYEFTRKELDKKNQAFVVCPLIEESETLDLKNATMLADYLRENELKGFNVGLLHGRMKAKEKDEIMMDFQNKKYDVLVSTTVIEVGINIPNATVMIVENAERFGLASLHQLRGRVGRSKKQSYCFLVVESNASIKRLKIMEETTDGFKISQSDLKTRGPGEFFGTRQHGALNLRLSNLHYDMELVKNSVSAAELTIADDCNLEKEENKFIKIEIDKIFSDRSYSTQM